MKIKKGSLDYYILLILEQAQVEGLIFHGIVDSLELMAND